MERFTISKSEKQTIYEIYRACRVCGAGGGYRMPIIQNIIDLDSSEVELRQKIQECLQLEVRPDDRMPPLICELCVDKLNDFYQFLELARQTNVKTRTRLGLPIQTAKKGEPESTDCILGVTEPVYVKEDEAPKNKAGPKSSKKIKNEPEVVKVKVENISDSSRSSSVSSRSERSTRQRRSLPASAPAPAPASAPATRRKLPEKDTRTKPETKAPVTPKNIEAPKEKKVNARRKAELQTLLEDNMKYQDDDNMLLVPRSLKRTREEPPRPALLPKRAKAALTKEVPKEPLKEPVKAPSPPRGRPGPKSRKPARPEPDPENIPVPLKVLRTKAKQETPAKPKEPPKPPPQEVSSPGGPPFKCVVCEAQIKSAGAFTNHMRIHVPCFTKPANACNPCGTWFLTPEEAVTHHRYHRAVTFPYHCRRCFDDFRTLPQYDDHIDKGLCVQEPLQVKCDECWAVYVNEETREGHKCPGRGGRPGGKCSKCARTYATAKTLKRHESQCGQRKAGDLIADPDVLRRLKPMRVRMTRCDDLVARENGDHCDVSRVEPDYGLAKNYIYPYMKLPPVKTKPQNPDSMVAVPVALKEELATDYTHWDSDDSDSDIIRKIPSLSTLAIKKLFSKNLLGKVPRKKKRVNYEEFGDFNYASTDMNDIISSLGDLGNSQVDRNAFTAKIKDIIGCLDDSETDVNVDGNEDKIDEKVSEDVGETTNESRQDGNDTEKNSYDSTKENIIESYERIDNYNFKGSLEETSGNKESSNVEASVSEELANVEASASEESSNVEASVSNTVLEQHSNLDDENEIDRIDMEIENLDNCKNDKEIHVSLQNSVENQSEGATVDMEVENLNSCKNDKEIDVSLQNSVENQSEGATVDMEVENLDSCKNDKEIDVSLQNSVENQSEGATVDMEVENLDSCKNDKEIDVSLQNFVQNQSEGATIDMEVENVDSCKNDQEIDVSLQNSENQSEAAETRLENMTVNGISHENDNCTNDDKNSDINETKKSEEIKQTKESPIKHSIENLIGETDKNPDKYINEVISSIEDIIMKNNRTNESPAQNGQENEISDRNLMDALDEQIGEKRVSDNDKITLEDLLPKENMHEELENISDDDFNFDA